VADSIDDYINGFDGWREATLLRLRAIVAEAAPEASGSIKWAQPVWTFNGPMAYMRAFTNSVNIGFWRGGELEDPDGLLLGEGERMKHLSFREGDAIPEEAIHDFVRQALELNASKGDPTRRGGGAS
jgi:hypothetical protein